MAGADVLLSRLEGVQKQGDAWRARCPSCGGRSRKLSVKEVDDGRVLVHCFGGCESLAVVQAAGLALADLFPEPLADDSPDARRRRRRAARESQWGAALEVIEFEARIVVIAAADLAHGVSPSPEDGQRLALALQRIEDARDVLRDRPLWRKPQEHAA